jgi:hypothetical protein
MAALAGGIVALILGIIGIIVWFWEFLDLLKGAIPVMLILGGALAAYLGFEELKDKNSLDTFDDSPSDLKQEVESLKEEIQELKGDKKGDQPEEDK